MSVRLLFEACRFAAATLLLALVAPNFPLPACAAHDRVRFALVSEPTSLNPLFSSGYWLTVVKELAFEPLLRLGPNNEFVPALATAEPTLKNGGISADGRTITFHLRRATRWSDGSPVTSAAFDRARRTRALASFQRDLVADATFVPLFRKNHLWASAAWRHGLNPSPYGPFWNVYDWSIGDSR